jgi:hypothetical protein
MQYTPVGELKPRELYSIDKAWRALTVPMAFNFGTELVRLNYGTSRTSSP